MKASAEEGKKLRLTVFLIKEGYKTIEEFVEVGSLQRYPAGSQGGNGTLFFKSGFRNIAPWASVFENVPDFDPSRASNQNCRALYILKDSGRWFCFTFGYTRQLLKQETLERKFGLIVSLNLGDPAAIKAIDKTNISHVGLHSREQAGRDVGFEGFEFNTDIDLLKSMTAKAPLREGEEQETYSGRDSITVYTRVTLASFPDLANRFLKAFTNTAYKKTYPWVDKITEERDPTIVARLDSALVSAINAGEHGKIWMAVPEIVNWEEVENFAYRLKVVNEKRAGPILQPDVDVESWLIETKLRGHLTLNHLKNRKVYQLFKDGRDPAGWSAYRCMNAEIDLDGQKYILNDGDWYNVDRDYVGEIANFYNAVPASTLTLPHYGTMPEPAYLRSIPKKHPQFAMMDQKNIMIGGSRNRVEFCDLYSKNKDIVHVKKYGGSSVLSHLFSQAVVSGESFLHEPDFRKELNTKLPTGFKLTDPAKAPSAAAHTICLAIMSRVPGPLELPFFSKVSLKHAVTSLQRMNYKVTKLKIER